MPRGNRMGPFGEGPRTGRGAGFCAGYDAPGYANPTFGRGYGMGGGRGRGGGHGWRHWFHATGQPGWMRAGEGYPGRYAGQETPFAPLSHERELEELKAQTAYFKENIQAIENRIQELETSRKEEG